MMLSGGVLTGVRCWISRREAEAGVLREMDRRSSWLSALGREPYMEGEKKLAEMLGRPMPSHRLRSSCDTQIQCQETLSLRSTLHNFCHDLSMPTVFLQHPNPLSSTCCTCPSNQTFPHAHYQPSHCLQSSYAPQILLERCPCMQYKVSTSLPHSPCQVGILALSAQEPVLPVIRSTYSVR